jgi:hypothetical protein
MSSKGALALDDPRCPTSLEPPLARGLKCAAKRSEGVFGGFERSEVEREV